MQVAQIRRQKCKKVIFDKTKKMCCHTKCLNVYTFNILWVSCPLFTPKVILRLTVTVREKCKNTSCRVALPAHSF